MAKSRIPNDLDVADTATHKNDASSQTREEWPLRLRAPLGSRVEVGLPETHHAGAGLSRQGELEVVQLQQCSLQKWVSAFIPSFVVQRCKPTYHFQLPADQTRTTGRSGGFLWGWYGVPMLGWMCLCWFGITKLSVGLRSIYSICRADGVEMLMWVNICHIWTVQSGCILAYTL